MEQKVASNEVDDEGIKMLENLAGDVGQQVRDLILHTNVDSSVETEVSRLQGSPAQKRHG
jgi:hypothetical protein